MTRRLLTDAAVDAALAEAAPPVLDVYEAVRQGDATLAAQCVPKLDAAQRRVCLDVLKKLRAANRGEWWWELREPLRALAVAGTGCQTGAAAAAAWCSAREFGWVEPSRALLLEVLADRAPEWLADLVHRLATRPPAANVSYDLMAGLVRLAGCPAPTTEAYVHGWIFSHFRSRRTSLVEALRADPDLTPLVQAVFVTPDVGSYSQFTFPGEEGENTWHEALALLTREGLLDRAMMVDSCVARLLRGGRQVDERWFLHLLDALAPTREEQLAHLADWCALASDASSPVAARAQAMLGALAQDGGLGDARLADVTRAVLFRTEKKLVRTQLVLLGKVLKARPEAAPVLLPAVTEAFGHSDTDVQERALKLIGRHTRSLDRLQLAELATAADLLSPGLRAPAAEILGQPVGDADEAPYAYEEFLPPAPEPVPFGAPVASAAEVAEEVSVLLASSSHDLLVFERALDGLMRQAHRDRDALAEALRPVVEAYAWWQYVPSWVEQPNSSHFLSSGIEIVVAAALGQLPTGLLHHKDQEAWSGAAGHRTGPAGVHGARCWEAAHRIRSTPLPFLLATPTDSSGAIAPDVLVERLEEYTRLGARVGEADFCQALLRVRFGDSAEEAERLSSAARAEALGTSFGACLAGHLRSGRLPAPSTHRRRQELYRADSVLIDLGELPRLREQFHGPAADLGLPVTSARAHHDPVTHYPHLLAVLPAQPDVVAARLLPFMCGVACHDFSAQAGYLPALAEAPAPAGEAVHLSVAYGLAARRPQDRLEAVDALLVLAARGALAPERLGGDITELCGLDLIRPGRIAAALRSAAETGACATVWAVLRAALPGVLGAEGIAPKALGDFLEVGAECVERCGARGEIPEVTALAGQGGRTRVQRQARRLYEALAS